MKEPNIEVYEVEKQLKKLKEKKAAGLDNIKPELLLLSNV